MSPSAPYFQNVRLSDLVLRVRDLDTVRRFYETALGLCGREAGAGRVTLSSGEDGPPLVVLVEAPGAPARPVGAAGLFHVAFLHRDRGALGRAARRLNDLDIEFAGGDHGVSEALYLSDPEGNGIELYVDRNVSDWPVSNNGDVAMYTEDLDINGILREGEASAGSTDRDRVRIGHIHLSVADLGAAEQLIAQGLGFPVRQRNYAGALFFGRDGYHHHFGANVWRSRLAAPKGCLGLDRFTLSLRPAPRFPELSASLHQLGVFAEETGPDAHVFRTADGIGLRVASLTDAEE